MTVGIILGYPICGILAEELHWEYIFYVTGGLAIIWAGFWFFSISNTPGECKYISVVRIFFSLWEKSSAI